MIKYNIQKAIHQAVRNLSYKAYDAMIISEIKYLVKEATEEDGLEMTPGWSMAYAVQAVRKLLDNREVGAGSFANGDWSK